MKKYSALFLMAMLFVAQSATAQNSIEVSTPSMSACKWDEYYAQQTTRSHYEDEFPSEWLDYSVIQCEDGLYLHFIHENLELNCAVSKVLCSAKIEGSVITIDESINPLEEYADCECLYDVTYDVGPLQEGDYTLIVTFHDYKLAEMDVHIGSPLRGRFNISDFVTKIENTTLAKTKPSKIIYDLQGRRYKTFPHPGIFIQDGKKIVWKGK